jgi:hypothetical protein
VVDGGTVSPCAAAGGTATGRIATLVQQDVPQPYAGLGEPLATVGICAAELTATVNGLGINSREALTTC